MSKIILSHPIGGSSMGTGHVLIRPGVLDAVRSTAERHGFVNDLEPLLTAVDETADRLGRCLDEADAVLGGSLEAATRLWLLLREPGPELGVPTWLTRASSDPDRGPATLDADAVLRLIAGTVRAANQPAEADLMLANLGRLLAAVFVLEAAHQAAITALEAENPSPLATLATALTATTLTGTTVVRDAPGPVLQDRPDWDPGAWGQRHTAELVDWHLNWLCGDETRRGMSQVDRFGARYAIEGLSDPNACPGQRITIRGSNFGPAGRVSFPSPPLSDPAFEAAGPDVLTGVVPLSWTDTRIDVVVPPWATSGMLHLNAFTRHETLCATIDVYRLGNAVPFTGGLATVYQVSVGGVPVDLESTARTLLVPGDSVALTWHSSAGPGRGVQVELFSIEGGIRQRLEPAAGGAAPVHAGGVGGTVLTVPASVTHATEGELVLTASGPCGRTVPLEIPVIMAVPATLRISFVEVTQGVQVDAAGVAAGQAMPTVALKDTAVRVHLVCDRGGWRNDYIDGVTGVLRFDGVPLAPTDPGHNITVLRASNPDESYGTLNFLVPAGFCTAGPHRLDVRVLCDDVAGRVTTGSVSTWSWAAKTSLAVRVFRFGRSILEEGRQASMRDAAEFARAALDPLPTALNDIQALPMQWWYENRWDLTNRDDWSGLLDAIELNFALFGQVASSGGRVMLGVLPEQFMPPNPVLRGIGDTPGLGALAREPFPDAASHELGHTQGLHHVHLPASGPGQPSDPYDTVENGGILLRPAFDVRSQQTVPRPTGDLMSYMLPIRPGTTTWMRLFTKAF